MRTNSSAPCQCNTTDKAAMVRLNWNGTSTRRTTVGSRSRREAKHVRIALAAAATCLVLFLLWFRLTMDQAQNDNDMVLSSGLLQFSTRTSNTYTNDDNSKKVNAYWWPSEKEGGVLGALHDWQHPAVCPGARFLVFRSTGKEDRGLTAWAKTASAHFAHALSEKRILLSDQVQWPMAQDCPVIQTHECFLEPLSNCTLKHADPPTNTTHSFVMEKSNDVYDSSQIRTLYSQQTWFKPIPDHQIWEAFGLGTQHNRLYFEAATLAYYFRPRPWLQQQIHARLQRSIPSDLIPDQTIGLPLRRSDKCRGHDLTGHPPGEMACVPLERLVEACQSLVHFDPRIRNVIVTSEDRAALKQLVSLIHQQLPQLRVVTNVGDVQQGTGSSKHRTTAQSNVTNHEIMASAFTSLHMHLRARYLVLTTKSSWVASLAVLSRVYGFSSRDVLAVDLTTENSIFKCLARQGAAC